MTYEAKNEKIKVNSGESHLTKVGSVGKFSVVKKVDKHFFRNDQ